MALTNKQEKFAQLIALQGLNYSDAYRKAYNVSSETAPVTVWTNANHLAAHTKVAPRIAELKAAAQKLAVTAQAWTLERIIEEAKTNLELSRTHRQLGSANGALEIIGRATGLLTDKPRDPVPPQITRVVVVLDSGDRSRQRVVEAAYEVLPVAEGDEKEE